MARKTCRVTIDADGRDKGKTFILTELPALDIERWTVRLVLALGKNGVNLPNTSQVIKVEDVTFQNFDRAIFVHNANDTNCDS